MREPNIENTQTGTADPVPSESHRSILIIDDDEDIRCLLRDELEDHGYEVIEAVDGHDARRIYERIAVDLAILDLVMPNQEGFETLRALRGRFPHIPVIVISGAFNGMFLNSARMLGANAIFQKPFSCPDVIHTIRTLLA